MCVAHLPVSVQTLVYLESEPFPNQPHRGLWLSGPQQEMEDKNTPLNLTGTTVALEIGGKTAVEYMYCC